MPRPKLASYDRDAGGSFKSFMAGNIDADHPFYGHPILHELGELLARASFDHIFAGFENLNNCGLHAHKANLKIGGLEKNHEDYLTDVARSLVESVWGIPPDQMKGGIDPRIMDPSEVGIQEDEAVPSLWDMSPELILQVQKRLTLNTVIQGAAVHAMLFNTRMVRQEIEKVSPDLPDLHDAFVRNALGVYFKGEVTFQVAGYERVKFEQREDMRVPVVYATGINFPLMLHEFVKGVVEVICIHGLADLSKEESDAVIVAADQMIYEPPQIAIGPELWRRLLAVMPQDVHPADFLENLSKTKPEPMMAFVADAVKGREP